MPKIRFTPAGFGAWFHVAMVAALLAFGAYFDTAVSADMPAAAPVAEARTREPIGMDAIEAFAGAATPVHLVQTTRAMPARRKPS